MARYHMGENGEPSICRAKPGNCPRGGEHFNTLAEARTRYEEMIAASSDSFASLRKSSSNSSSLKLLEDNLNNGDYDAVISFADSSMDNYKLTNDLINARIKYTKEYNDKLNKINPNIHKDNCVTKNTFKEFRRSYQSYRDQTAVLIEAAYNSRYHSSPKNIVELKDTNTIGNLKKATNYDHNDPNWHLSRYNSIGGSDVGAIAMQDFVSEDKLSSFDKLYIKKIENSKIVPPTEEEAMKSIANSELSRRGALYRGTVWEDKIRDDYAVDHPDYTVYKVKDQFVSKDNDWQKVNLDGLISDRADKVPNGILEIKTGGEDDKWKDGVPLSYRVQTLYYLNATGFKYADVRVLLNDNESRDYRLYKEDDVVPNCGVDMNTYMKERVEPWFEGLKAQRDLKKDD